MHFIQKIIQLKTFVVLVVSVCIHLFIYKHFERKKIRRDEEDISGKCVVVTGGSSGIGRSSAREFARRGATVVIGDVDLKNGQKVVEEIQRETGNMNVVIMNFEFKFHFVAVLCRAYSLTCEEVDFLIRV